MLATFDIILENFESKKRINECNLSLSEFLVEKEFEGKTWICMECSEDNFNEFKKRNGETYTEEDVKPGFVFCEDNGNGNYSFWIIVEKAG